MLVLMGPGLPSDIQKAIWHQLRSLEVMFKLEIENKTSVTWRWYSKAKSISVERKEGLCNPEELDHLRFWSKKEQTKEQSERWGGVTDSAGEKIQKKKRAINCVKHNQEIKMSPWVQKGGHCDRNENTQWECEGEKWLRGEEVKMMSVKHSWFFFYVLVLLAHMWIPRHYLN